MNTNNLNTALYEKMATEQEKYRDWLKSQPPEEILHHTVVRQINCCPKLQIKTDFLRAVLV